MDRQNQIISELDQLSDQAKKKWEDSSETPDMFSILRRRDELMIELMRIDPDHHLVHEWLARF